MKPYEVSTDEMVLVLRPIMEEDGTWDGQVQTGLAMHPESSLDKDTNTHLFNLITLLAATLDVFNEQPEIYEYVRDMRDELFFTEEEEDEVEYESEGNLITITRFTKTSGNA